MSQKQKEDEEERRREKKTRGISIPQMGKVSTSKESETAEARKGKENSSKPYNQKEAGTNQTKRMDKGKQTPTNRVGLKNVGDTYIQTVQQDYIWEACLDVVATVGKNV
eukprot:6017215-Ditylum_brightwellii.AAC.1